MTGQAGSAVLGAGCSAHDAVLGSTAIASIETSRPRVDLPRGLPPGWLRPVQEFPTSTLMGAYRTPGHIRQV
jgi:hypothetical protein